MQLALLGTVLVMGFMGSWHCAVMCGPFSCNFRKNRDFFSYHIGRLLSYLLLGTLLFYGIHFFADADSRPLRAFATLLFGGLFVFFGVLQLGHFKNRGLLFKFYKLQFQIIEKNQAAATRFPVVLGLLTGLFPCAWLYSFLLLGSQMQTPAEAWLVILLFWATALPSFMVFTGFMKNLMKNSPVRYQTISGIVLIIAGLLSVLAHWAEVFRL